MQKRLFDLLKFPFPLGAKKRAILKELEGCLTKREMADLHYLAKLRKVGFHEESFGTSKGFAEEISWPQLTPAMEDEELNSLVESINAKSADKKKLIAFQAFRTRAVEKIASLVATNIVGLDAAKEAAALQLFAAEPFHILLLGDPGTGKTEILRSIEKLAEQAVFGLGSGASKAGLLGVYQGDKFQPGLLVEADEGIALVDELNLLKKEDRAGLYSAMEKGFVTYDKGGKHERFDARVRVLATANPKGDKFVGKDIKFLKSQLPFDDALLSRFHTLLLVRKPGGRELERITRKIVQQQQQHVPEGDARFVREFVAHAEKLNVSFEDKFESMVVDFVEELKSNEQNFLVEVGPRMILGTIRMAKAYARARLSRHVNADDLERAMKLLKATLEIK